MTDQIIIEEVQQDIQRVQNFDPKSLVNKELHGAMSFEEAVEPARRLIELFRRISTDSIRELPFQQNMALQEQAKSTYLLFEQVLSFTLSTSDPEGTRKQIIDQINQAFQPTFNSLYPLISYLVARTVDFASLESKGRAAIQTISDDRDQALALISETSDEAARILKEVRDAAAEQGVTQTARYFSDEARIHQIASGRWLIATVVGTFIVVGYSVSTLFFADWFSPSNVFESTQIITSKLLVFGVLLYGLLQCVRSYSAHRHNHVANKHRQNALMTYKTLAEAGNSVELRDAVLQHAAAAIYAPNDSGYLKSEERGYGAQSLLALIPRATGSNSTSGN